MSKVKVTKKLAQKIARDFAPAVKWEWSVVRDHCDSATWGALDCFQLDLLTDWVFEDLARQAAA